MIVSALWKVKFEFRILRLRSVPQCVKAGHPLRKACSSFLPIWFFPTLQGIPKPTALHAIVSVRITIPWPLTTWALGVHCGSSAFVRMDRGERLLQALDAGLPLGRDSRVLGSWTVVWWMTWGHKL